MKRYLFLLSVLSLFAHKSNADTTFAWDPSTASGYDSNLISYELKTKKNAENWVLVTTAKGQTQITRNLNLIPGDGLIVQLRAIADSSFNCDRTQNPNCDKSSWVSFSSLPTIDTAIIYPNKPSNLVVNPIEMAATPSFTGAPLGSGSSAQAGSFTLTGSSWKMIARGDDIWGTSDSGYFASKQKTGNFELSMKVETIQTPAPNHWSKIGIMARESLSPGSKNVFFSLTYLNGLSLQTRLTDGASTTSVLSSGFTSPVFLKLKRQGDLFTAYRSVDGTNWFEISNTTVSLSPTIYIGIASSSHNSNVSFESTVNSLSGF